jgi:hypothetical protein
VFSAKSTLTTCQVDHPLPGPTHIDTSASDFLKSGPRRPELAAPLLALTTPQPFHFNLGAFNILRIDTSLSTDSTLGHNLHLGSYIYLHTSALLKHHHTYLEICTVKPACALTSAWSPPSS